MRRFAAVVVLALGLGASVAVVADAPVGAVTATAVGGVYHARPGTYRVLDTRTGAGPNRKGALGHGKTMRVTLAGHVSSTASAALISLTTTSPTTNGFLTAYQYGAHRPSVYSHLFTTSRTTTTTVLVKLSHSSFDIYNGAKTGSTQVLADLIGYYSGGASAPGPGVMHVATPHRVLAATAIGAGKTRIVKVGGLSGVVHDVVVTLGATHTSRSGKLAAYAYGAGAPSVPNFYYPATPNSSGLIVVRTDTSGRFVVRNEGSGTATVSADLVGYDVAGPVVAANALQAVGAQRVLSAHTIAAGKVASVSVAGKAGVPLSGTGSVLVSVTAGATTRGGGLDVGAPGKTTSRVRNVSFNPGQVVGATLIVPTSGGRIDVRNATSGSLKAYVDVLGYLPSTTISAPRASVGRYPNDLVGNTTTDKATLAARGAADGKAHSPFVLLDVGAQSISAPTLNKHPGVVVALTGKKRVAIPYGDLVADITAYLNAYADNSGGTHATIAIGTNNDGVWTPGKSGYYSPTLRGEDWANRVVLPLAAAAAPLKSLKVVGADDIESNFASDQHQARAWEQVFLRTLIAKGNAGPLIYNGSANGCPTTFGATGACAYGWTQAQYAALASTASFGGTLSYRGHIQVLPQIYFSSQAVKWANIDKASGRSLKYTGVLTEAGAEDSYSRPAGWHALYRALSSVRKTVSLPASVDIRPDS